MWSEPVVTSAAANEPVTLTEAKAHCRVTSSDSDTLISGYIAAARDMAENWTGVRIVTQTVEVSRRNFWSRMTLPVAPVQSLSITYFDEDNSEQTLATSVYDFTGANTLLPVVSLADGQSWPNTYAREDAITVSAVVGYSATPDAIKQAILLLVGQWFDHRENAADKSMSDLPFATTALLENYRTF